MLTPAEIMPLKSSGARSTTKKAPKRESDQAWTEYPVHRDWTVGGRPYRVTRNIRPRKVHP